MKPQKDSNGNEYMIVRAGYPMQITVDGKLLAPADTTIPPEFSDPSKNIPLPAKSSIILGSDFTQVLVLGEDGNAVNDSSGSPIQYGIGRVAFNGLSLQEYVNRVQDTSADGKKNCDKLKQNLDKTMKKLYGNDYRQQLIAKLGQKKFEQQYPILNGRCYIGAGRVPAGKWMCDQQDCEAGANVKVGQAFQNKDGNKTCVILDNAPISDLDLEITWLAQPCKSVVISIRMFFTVLRIKELQVINDDET